MRVLVTGHNGYIGTVMVPVLAAAGHEVVGLDSNLFEPCVLGPAPDPVPALTCDLRDVDGTDLAGFDAVVHLAALSNDPVGDLDPAHTHAINHHASVRLARLAKDAGVRRFVYASSCSVYGATGTDDLLDEHAPMAPVSAYAVSKVRVEDDLHELADASFSPVSMRNATVYGFSPRHRTDLVLNDLVGRAVLTGEITVLSDGTPWRPIVHVADVAGAVAAMLDAPREAIHDQAFNVGTDADNYQVRDIAAIVAEAVPGAQVRITGETGPDPRSYRVDFAKIRRQVPGFAPAWDARAGAEQLVAAYREHGLDEDGFARRYRRLRWLREQLDSGRLGPDLRWVTAHAPGERR